MPYKKQTKTLVVFVSNSSVFSWYFNITTRRAVNQALGIYRINRHNINILARESTSRVESEKEQEESIIERKRKKSQEVKESATRVKSEREKAGKKARNRWHTNGRTYCKSKVAANKPENTLQPSDFQRSTMHARNINNNRKCQQNGMLRTAVYIPGIVCMWCTRHLDWSRTCWFRWPRNRE